MVEGVVDVGLQADIRSDSIAFLYVFDSCTHLMDLTCDVHVKYGRPFLDQHTAVLNLPFGFVSGWMLSKQKALASKVNVHDTGLIPTARLRMTISPSPAFGMSAGPTRSG